MPNPQTLDFALLHQAVRRHTERNWWVLAWLLGLLVLLVGTIVGLVLYLGNFEADEELRRRGADAQWLEQSVQFHFRRLEDDLDVLARQGALADTRNQTALVTPPPTLGGLLWRQPGVVVSLGWIAAAQPNQTVNLPERWRMDANVNPVNAELLRTMQDISRGLRRAAYAGPMLQRDGEPTDVVWLAVPFYERGVFTGNFVAALSMERAVQALVPDWFRQTQTVRLVADETQISMDLAKEIDVYRAPMNLPGVDLYLEISPTRAQPATVPRIFFMVALLFLVGMLFSLYALRRDFRKRQRIQALLQAEVALRTAMENSVAIGLRAWDLEGKILYVNEAFCRMVGYRVSELVGKTAPLPYWPADQTNELRLVHRDILAQGTQVDGVEVQFQHREGRLVDVLINEAPLNTADGEQLGWMSSVQDISERKRAQRVAALQQEKLEASGRLVAVGEVASTLAHELNQPLGALSSFSSGLLNRLRGGSITLEEMEPVVARMAALAQRAGAIIQRVNAFARRREISRHQLDLMALVRRVLSSTAELQVRHVSLVESTQPVWIEADGLLIEHLIANLVGNAVDWAHRGGRKAQVRVWLEIDAAQQFAALIVADSGPGVPPENQTNIFDAFFSTKDGGMGMGLAICRSIVEAHHGRIDVGLDPDLGGARFTVRLPLDEVATINKNTIAGDT
jgi:two-component system sensor histidine kinase DctS